MRASGYMARFGAAGGAIAAMPWLLLGGLLMLASIFGVGFAAGQHFEARNAERERQTAVAEAARRYEAQLADGAQRVAELQDTLREQAGYQTRLQEKLRHAPIVAAAPRACVATLDPGSTGAKAPTPAPLPDGPAGVQDAVVVELQLSHVAVSLWNSALVGADVASGACSPDGAAGAACAAGSGITFERAWANHAENAASCAADRARYRSLIGYVEHLHSLFKPR